MKETQLAKELTRILNIKGIPHHHNVSEFFTPLNNQSQQSINRHYGQIKKFKLEGWTSGFPDYTIFTDKIIFLELKKKDGRLSNSQKEWKELIEKKYKDSECVEYVLIKGVDDMMIFLERL